MMRDHLNQALYGARRSAIRAFSALAGATPGCMSLTLGEPDFDTPAPVKAAVGEALDRGETHYIDNNGSPALRRKIADYERERHGMDYTADEVVVTAGATEALFLALFGILNPGDEVIVPTPAFLLYEQVIRLCRGKFVPLDTTGDGFQIDGEKLAGLVNERTRAILLNSPNNPTGCILNEKSLAAVRRVVEGKPIFVLCDDVYRELVYEGEYHSFAEFRDLREQILVIQSCSKPWAMTGWRMGWLLADQSVKERLELLHQFLVVSTPAPFQRAAMAALDQDITPMVETYRRRRAYALERLAGMELEVRVPRGAFYVFPSIRALGLSSEEFCTRLIREGGLAVTPGACFGGEGHIRLSYCYSDGELREGLDRLERFVTKLREEG